MDFIKKNKLIYCLAILLCFQTINAGRWIISIKTSDHWMAGFVGDVTVCLTLQQPEVVDNSTETTNSSLISDEKLDSQENELITKEDCQTLPWRLFERGKPYIFGLDYTEGLVLESARIYAKILEDITCKRNSIDIWHIDEISFQNLVSGQVFEKKHHITKEQLKPMLLEARCGNNNKKELIIDTFNISIQPRPCSFDGVIYKDGESFEDGCSALCECSDGGISCVSRCPPSIAPKCREIFVPSQCCPMHICEQTILTKSCPMYEENDCETANRTVDPGEYPWAAFIKLCDTEGCKRFCSGALLNEHWILTAAECFSWNLAKPVKPEEVRVIVGEQTLILAEDRDVEIPVENITISPGKYGNLALIKLKEPIVFDRAVQPAVLPINREHCMQLIQPSCAISLTGWISIDSPGAEQYELYKLSTSIEDSSSCATSSIPNTLTQLHRKRKPPPPRLVRDNSLCIDLSNSDPLLQRECGTCQADANSSDTCAGDKNVYLCTGERGRTLVSKVQVPDPIGKLMEVNYVVGLISYSLSPEDTAAGMCKKSAYRLALGVCNELSWITATMTQSDLN